MPQQNWEIWQKWYTGILRTRVVAASATADQFASAGPQRGYQPLSIEMQAVNEHGVSRVPRKKGTTTMNHSHTAISANSEVLQLTLVQLAVQSSLPCSSLTKIWVR